MFLPFLIHVPYVGFLTSIVVLVLVDEVHEEEEVVGKVVLLLHVDVEPVRYTVQVVLPYAADETVVAKFILYALQLVTKRAERVNDETLDDGQQDNNDEQEEGDVEEDADELVLSAVRWLNNVTNTTSSTHSLVQMEHKAGEHVVALLVGVLSFLTLRNIELSEEVEGKHGVDVANDREEANGQHQLLSVVRNGLQDDPEGGHSNSNINEMGSEEEVVVVAKNGEDKVE